MNSEAIKRFREKLGNNDKLLADFLVRAEQLLIQNEKETTDSFHTVIKSFSKLLDDITVDSFVNATEPKDVNERITLDIHVVVDKLLQQISEEGRSIIVSDLLKYLPCKETQYYIG